MENARIRLSVISVMILTLIILNTTIALAAPFQYGDVFVAVGSGSVQHRDSSGALVENLNTGLTGYTTGMAFDSSGNLYVTAFSVNKVAKFDNSGNYLGTFGTGVMSSPESIIFDGSGNAYVGNVGGYTNKYDASGNYLSQVYSQRTDFIDLKSDQCTMLISDEGSIIHSQDVCNNLANGDFASGLTHTYALRILSDNGVLVADSSNIKRLNSAGAQVQTYDYGTENSWFALNLDPDGSSFWSADFSSANVYKFDIASGTKLLNFNTGTGYYTVFGLVVYGEQTAATGSISGKKYNDANGNGVVNGGETGLQDWTITMKDVQGNTIATTTTNVNGDYSFGSLQAGTYIVSEVSQAGWSQTAPASGTYTINLGAGQNVGNKDFLNTQGTCNGGTCIPEFPTVALPIMSVLGIMFLMSRKKHN